MYQRRLQTLMTSNDKVVPNCSRKHLSKRCVLDEHTASFTNLKVYTVRQLCKTFPLVQRCFRMYQRHLQTLMTSIDKVVPTCSRKRLSKRRVLDEHTASFVDLKVQIVRQLCESFPLIQRCFRMYQRPLQTLMTSNDGVVPNCARKCLSRRRVLDEHTVIQFC